MRRTNGSYVTPYSAAGVEQSPTHALGRYSFTLTNGTTYYFPIGSQEATILSAHVQWDASIILTSITLEDCNIPESDADWYSSTAGEWIDEDPTTAFVALVGAGATATNGVVAVTGGAAGGAMIHAADTGARRTRLKVVVGATGGSLRVSAWGKE